VWQLTKIPVHEAELNKRALHWNAEATRIVRAQHGYDDCMIGGVATIFEELLYNPRKYSIFSIQARG
jgi:hypothetical protein